MSLIEGIGDEVTFVFASIFIVLLIICAWFSTHTRDIPFFSVLIVELTRRGARTPTEQPTNETEITSENSSSQDSNPSDVTEVTEVEQEETQEGNNSEDIQNSPSNDFSESSTSENNPDHIRKCRLQFLSKQSPDSVVISTSESNVPTAGSPPVIDHTITEERINSQDNTESPIIEEVNLEGGAIQVKLKYLDESFRLVHTNPLETIGQFKRAHFGPELASNKLVRLIYNGQCLQNDSSTLQSYNIQDNCTVHCLITELRRTESQSYNNISPNVDLSVFMIPFFVMLLATIWYFRFTYRQYFSAMSTLSLLGITFLFSLFVFSSWRARQPQEGHQHVD